MLYYLGVDGGGTKTEFALAYETGRIAATYITEGCSYKHYGIDNAVVRLRDGAERCLAGAGTDPAQLGGICFGLPCFGESAESDRILKNELKKAFAGVSVYLTNDVEVGWAGSLAAQPGINIVSGTGSIAFGKDLAGKTSRCGGWSEFFGDEGSCYWVGRKTMELFCKQADGRLPKAALYHIIRDEFSLTDDFEFIEIMDREYIPYREQVAKMQLYLEKAALANDLSAAQIYTEAADELALIVSGILRQLDFGGEVFAVSYSGGIFRAGELILTPFAQKIGELGGRMQKPELTPVCGAILCAVTRFAPQITAKMIEAMKQNRR